MLGTKVEDPAVFVLDGIGCQCAGHFCAGLSPWIRSKLCPLAPSAEGIILTQRKGFKGGRHQDAAEIGMIFKDDAEHVVDLAAPASSPPSQSGTAEGIERSGSLR